MIDELNCYWVSGVRITKFAQVSKMCNFFICVTHFLQFKEILVVNNTGYNFCVLLNILQCKSDCEKNEH